MPALVEDSLPASLAARLNDQQRQALGELPRGARLASLAGSLGLTEAERRGVLDECTMWARQLYAQDRVAFRRFVAHARTLDPDVAPTNPGYVTAAARYVGYEAAEGIANLARMPRTLVRKTLQKAGLRAQNGLFEY